ncbi:MAG: DUF2336 domain-containing protein [Xanthobacteraceae bacterium]
MPPAQDNERAAAILERRAQGLLALDEALAELADANCVVTIAAVAAERIRTQPEVVARALDAESDEPISVICRAAGFSLNGFSAVLRMRRRRHHGGRNATEALAYFSGLNRASAERILQQMAPHPARPGRRFR